MRNMIDGIARLQAAARDKSQPYCGAANCQNQSVGEDVPHGLAIMRDKRSTNYYIFAQLSLMGYAARCINNRIQGRTYVF